MISQDKIRKSQAEILFLFASISPTYLLALQPCYRSVNYSLFLLRDRAVKHICFQSSCLLEGLTRRVTPDLQVTRRIKQQNQDQGDSSRYANCCFAGRGVPSQEIRHMTCQGSLFTTLFLAQVDKNCKGDSGGRFND